MILTACSSVKLWEPSPDLATTSRLSRTFGESRLTNVDRGAEIAARLLNAMLLARQRCHREAIAPSESGRMLRRSRRNGLIRQSSPKVPESHDWLRRCAVGSAGKLAWTIQETTLCYSAPLALAPMFFCHSACMYLDPIMALPALLVKTVESGRFGGSAGASDPIPRAQFPLCDTFAEPEASR